MLGVFKPSSRKTYDLYVVDLCIFISWPRVGEASPLENRRDCIFPTTFDPLAPRRTIMNRRNDSPKETLCERQISHLPTTKLAGQLVCPHCQTSFPLTWHRYLSALWGNYRCPQCRQVSYLKDNSSSQNVYAIGLFFILCQRLFLRSLTPHTQLSIINGVLIKCNYSLLSLFS